MSADLSADEISACLDNAGQGWYLEKPLDQVSGPLRRAGVLVPLVRVDSGWHLLYTRRTDRVEHHKGQVSFPGGRMDPEDASEIDTALREAHEEVGIRPADVRVLGTLRPMVTISNYHVTPVVATLPWPYAFRVHTVEVGRVFTIPLVWLADPDNHQEFVRRETGRTLVAFLPYDGELLWGATARMTLDLLEVLGLLA